MRSLIITSILTLTTIGIMAQTAYGPYLQSPTPNSIWVSWVTSSGTESTLTWGTSSGSLTNTVTGTNSVLAATHNLHHAQITGLQPNTPYYYRVKTGTYQSAIYRFRTAPANGTNTGKIHYVVFGDTQDPTAVARVAPRIEQKLIARFGTNWEDSCRFMLKLGDNVDNGGTLSQYRDRFIGSIKFVSPKLPLLTVPGNHEYYGDAALNNYFGHVKYESTNYNNILGQDGEHYYAFQYANMVFVMFNSNETWQRQTDFVTNVVNAANNDVNVSWIFSSCHHPTQVEQYPSDMSTYVANTITPIIRNSPKGASMYFGHSHLYQRGATREGSLFQIINGGASWIQRWGQNAAQTNYPDVQKTIDHYLFQIVSMDLSNGKMSVETYSNGTDTYDMNNVLIDTYAKDLGKPAPAKPLINPVAGSITLPYTFQGSAYSGTLTYNSTQFQIVESAGSFTSPRIDVKRDFEDIYLATNPNAYSPIDQNAGVDIFKYTAASNALQAGLNKIRVRYRDRNLNWSAWSDPVEFTVSNGLPPAQQNPIAFYKFTNNTADSSGFNRHATNAGVTFAQDPTLLNQVGVFNNTGYADIATTATGLPIKNITVSAWVKTTTADTWGGFFGLVQDNGSTENGWVLGTRSQKFSFALRSTGNTALTYLTDVADFTLNQWYHVTGSYDGTNLKLYVNGVLKASSTAQFGNIQYPSSGWFTLGRYKDEDENYPHDGSMDNVKMWERTLSDAEVLAEYNNTNPIALPLAEFIATPNSVQAGQSISFTNYSHNASTYSWSFPGGTPTTSTAVNPVVTYNTAGQYNVSLTATGPGGSNTQVKTGLITVTALPASLPSGTYAYYKFKDNTADSSGYNNHAVNPVTSVTYENRGTSRAATFNGTNSYADVRSGAGAATGLPTAAITVMAWVKTTSFDTWGGFIGCVQDNGSTEKGWVLGTRNSNLSFALKSSGALNYLSSPEVSSTNTWYHVAGTYDGTTQRLYVNGVLKASSTAQTGPIQYATSHWFTLGRYKDENEDYKHAGAIDEAYIVNRALSQTEIQTIMNAAASLTSSADPVLANVAQPKIEAIPANTLAREALQSRVADNKLNATVYPNPSAGMFNVDISGTETTVTYEVANNLGRIIFAGQLPKGASTIDMSILPDGVYFLRFHNGIDVVGKKVIKKH